MRKYFLILNLTLVCWFFAGVILHAQVIKGQIIDINGRPVSYATLFIKELKQGTVANDEGYYELKTAEGVYTCVFQCLGYETETRMITVRAITNAYNIVLREKAYELREVIVTNNREDPAYSIIRRAIAMAPYYLNQVSEYNADVYLKGSFQVIKISALVKRLAKDELEGIKEGATYVEESFSEIEFTAPNKYNQKVLKKTSSMPNSESGSAMQLITTSIYDPTALEPIISPLSSNAFTHYRFRYEGFIEEGSRIINKIKITPARKSKQLLSGYIYIVDNFWNVHSIDVSGEFMMGINFRTQINFGEVNENVWMPVNHRMDFEGSVLGNKGAYQYLSSVKYNQIVENTSIRKPDALTLAEQQRIAMQQSIAPPVALTEKQEPVSKTSAKIEQIMEKENISNRDAYQLARLMQREADAEKKENQSMDLTETFRNEYKTNVDSAANQRDTAFWAMMRPTPLTFDELQSYREKELKLAEKKDTTNKSAVKSQSPFIRTTKKVLLGTSIKLGEKGGTLIYRGIKPSQYGFNTVDGFYIGQKLTWNKNLSQKSTAPRLSVTPEAVWAINRKAVMWDVNTSLTYAPMRRGSAQLKFGQITDDFSNLRTIHPLENTVSSLFFRRNYLKLYENNFVEANNTIDIANGLQLTANMKYAHRVMLENISDYSFFYRDSREYTPNVPINVELGAPTPDHTAATFMLNINYTPKQYYRIVSNQKRHVKSDFPTFSATWQKGVSGLLGSDSNFDHLAIGIQQKIETGFMQQLNYMIRGGAFVNRKSLFFPDFKHFNTVEIPVTMSSIANQSFNLLEYYRYSASDKYLEAHLYYETPFLLLRFLPFFSNNHFWKEGAQLNYLHTDGIKNYMELGYTIGSMIWRAGVSVGFENFNYRSFGVKLSLTLGN
jgi:hypothetical protein